MMLYGELLKILITGWALLSLLGFLSWLGLFSIALVIAAQRSYGGHWWGKYVLGLHALLQPVYLHLQSRSSISSKILAFVYQCLTLPLGIELPLVAKVGKGTVLNHTSGIVIHAGTIIGDNCTLHSGVVLGGKGRQDPPVIGNNVYIGANVVIAGAIRVGHDATIGACALVTQDVPDRALVGSVRAQIIKDVYERPYFNQGART